MKNGFTLIELLASIGIMAILVVAVLPFVSNYRAWAQRTANKRSAQLIYDAINRYNATNSRGINLVDAALADGGGGQTAIFSALVGLGPYADSAEGKVDALGNIVNPDHFLAKLPVSDTTTQITVNAAGQVTVATLRAGTTVNSGIAP